jgi:hypothetical protein
MSRLTIYVLLLIAIPLQSAAQKEIANQENAWLMYFGNHRISDRWALHTEYQWRRADMVENWQQSLLRLGVDYYAKNGIQYTAGYAWISSFRYGDQPIAHNNNEHRIWQQTITKSKVGRVDVQNRYRLEQRFIENWVKDAEGVYTQDGIYFRQRVRYRLLLTIPLSRKEMSDNTLFFAASDEPCLGFGPGIAPHSTLRSTGMAFQHCMQHPIGIP